MSARRRPCARAEAIFRFEIVITVMTDASLAASRRADTRDSRGGFAITNLPTSIRDAVRGLD